MLIPQNLFYINKSKSFKRAKEAEIMDVFIYKWNTFE